MDSNEENIDSINIVCHNIDDIEQCKTILTPQYKFKVLSFNIRSISKNFDSFLIALKRLDTTFDIIILTECRINEFSIIPLIPDYNAYRSNKIINQNSGVVVYIKSFWHANVHEPNFREADCLIIDIPDTITVFAVYRSPSFRNTDSFLLDLDSHFDKYKTRPQLVLAGDININISPNDFSNLNTSYLCINAEYGLLPAINVPTRYGSCLDHIFVKTMQDCVGIACKTDITDHDITILGLAYKEKNSTRSQRTILRKDVESIKSELADVDWSDVINAKDVNVAVSMFMDRITKIINRHTKIIKVSRSKHNLKPWITPGLIRCMKHRDKLHSRANKELNNIILQVTYKRYRNFCNKLLRNVKNQYQNSELQSCQGNNQKMWKVIKEICHMSSQKKEPNELLTLPDTGNPEQSLNVCNTYYSKVGQQLANDILQKLNKREDELAASIKLESANNSFYMQPTCTMEVELLIMNLHNNKAPGIDNLNNSLIKNIKNYIIEPLTSIFNLSITAGLFPEMWKTASICPIYKVGEKNVPGNYRPISLLGVFSKLLEKIMNKRLVKFLECQSILSSRQFGFRHGKSTSDAVSLLTSTIASNLDQNKACIGVFLDLAKAFDTVSIPVLLKKLQYAGIRGLPLNWFRSYLQGRKQCVRVGQYTSELQDVSFGVPQGSILGPTLFILYINDLQYLNIDNSEIICYADDTVILYSGANWSEVFHMAEEGMSKVAKWLQTNLLTLNTKKTHYLCFHKTRASSPQTFDNIKIHTCCNTNNDVRCMCDGIVRVETIKYLGVIIDQNLNFKAHIATLSSRTRNLTRIMRMLRNSASLDALKTVYYALCQSLLTYCIFSWGSAPKTVMVNVERAQRSVLKVMLRKHFRFPTDKLYAEAALLNVRQLFILNAAMSVHKSLLNFSDITDRSQRRVFHLPLPVVRTKFAHRFSPFVETRIYNHTLKSCKIKNLSVFEAKNIIVKWLLSLNYDNTEKLFTTVT